MAYSEDLRMPAVKHYLESGDTFEQTAKIFGVGKQQSEVGFSNTRKRVRSPENHYVEVIRRLTRKN